MALPQTPSPPQFYPQALQIKLYQAFIFSIPILFSIILLLLFYLFYLKRRTSTVSSTLPRSLNQLAASSDQMGLKGNLKEKLPIILFDEDIQTRDSQCCVCLGEFEIKEELHQVPSCKHVFHVDCIRLWLHSNSTCPLCRCSITTTAKHGLPEPPVGSILVRVNDENSNNPENNVTDQQQQQQQQQQEQVLSVSLNIDNHQYSREQSILQNIEGSSGATTTSFCIGYDYGMMGYPSQESVVLTNPNP